MLHIDASITGKSKTNFELIYKAVQRQNRVTSPTLEYADLA